MLYYYYQFKVFPVGYTVPHKKGTYPNFRQRPMSDIALQNQCWCGLATDIWKKSRLNWKLEISNAANNADNTQSQARDTRHRRMLEVNSLCTDSGPLRANTVLGHSTQYSLLVERLSTEIASRFSDFDLLREDHKMFVFFSERDHVRYMLSPVRLLSVVCL